MYKDKDRQREAVKLATRRYRRRVSHKVGSLKVSQAKSVIPTQSHNPMMVGYVPPQDRED